MKCNIYLVHQEDRQWRRIRSGVVCVSRVKLFVMNKGVYSYHSYIASQFANLTGLSLSLPPTLYLFVFIGCCEYRHSTDDAFNTDSIESGHCT